MGQKINPISLRLQTTNRYFDFCWYNDFFYSDLFCQNLKIQRYLNGILKQLQYPEGRLFIQNSQKKTKIFIFFCSPIKSRRIKSNFFKTKYYKITKNVLTGKKNGILKFLGKNKNKISSFVEGGFSVDGSHQKQIVGSYQRNQNSSGNFELRSEAARLMDLRSIHPTLGESIQEKSVYLKYLLYRKFLQKFYTSKEVNLIQPDLMGAELTKKKLKSSVFNLLSIFQIAKKKPLKGRTKHTQIRKRIFHPLVEQSSTHVSNIVLQSEVNKIKYKNKNNLMGHIVSAGNSSVELNRVQLMDQRSIYPQIRDKYFQTCIFFNPILYLNDLKKSKIFGNFRLSSLSVKQELLSKACVEERMDGITCLQSKYSDLNSASACLGIEQKQDGSKHLVPSSKKEAAGFRASAKENLFLYMGKLPYRKHIENVLTLSFQTNVKIHTVKTYDHFRSALFLAEEIVYYLERRIPFRRIKNKVLKDVKLVRAVEGIRITCSGRVGGRSKKAQRAKKETIKYGQTSLHVFSSRIDFASKNALTAFGLVGVKVWICYRA